MNSVIALGGRALREAVRQPDALFMTMFIPLFFLVVNTGQAAEIFPSDDTPFLGATDYMAAKIEGSIKVIVPDAGHAANIDNPEDFNKAMAGFLEGLA